MSYIYLGAHARLKAYSASVKGVKSIIRVEIECSDPGELGYLLEGLGEIDRKQRLAAKQAAAKRLRLPYFPADDEVQS